MYIIYSFIVFVAILAGRFFLTNQNNTFKKLRLPKLTVTIFAVLLLCYILQTFYPQLLFVGGIAEQLVTRKIFLTLFLLGGILANFIGLIFHPIGAGNSIANFSLIGAIFFITFLKTEKPIVRSFDILGFLFALLLVFLKDIHGLAVIIGAILCFLISKRKKSIML
jgi:hypothetical protein